MILNHVADAWHVPIPNRIILNEAKKNISNVSTFRNPLNTSQIPIELAKRLSAINVDKNSLSLILGRTNGDSEENQQHQQQRPSLKRKRNDNQFQTSNQNELNAVPLMQISTEQNGLFTPFC